MSQCVVDLFVYILKGMAQYIYKDINLERASRRAINRHVTCSRGTLTHSPCYTLLVVESSSSLLVMIRPAVVCSCRTR